MLHVAVTVDVEAGDEQRERAAARGCATVGVVLLLVPGVLLALPLAERLLRMAGDDAGRSVGMDATPYVWPFAAIFGVALLIAASPRGAAAWPVRWASGIVGALLVAEVVVVLAIT